MQALRRKGEDRDDFIFSPEYTSRLNRVFRCTLVFIGSLILAFSISLAIQLSTLETFADSYKARTSYDTDDEFSDRPRNSRFWDVKKGGGDAVVDFQRIKVWKQNTEMVPVFLWTLQFFSLVVLAAVLYHNLKLKTREKESADARSKGLRAPLLSTEVEDDAVSGTPDAATISSRAV